MQVQKQLYAKHKKSACFLTRFSNLEAPSGIEPEFTELQSVASPLCHSATVMMGADCNHLSPNVYRYSAFDR